MTMLKSVLTFFIFIFLTNTSQANINDFHINIDSSIKPYTFVEQMPEFEGGNSELMKYLSDNIKFLSNSDSLFQTLFIVQFTIDIDGSISDIYIKKGQKNFNDELIKIIKKMPNWKPGSQYGIKVPVRYNLPIRICTAN
jgi:periplasmic protein TonB